jgi:hypothetical protein
MKMDIYECFEKINNAEKVAGLEKFMKDAEMYSEQGFDEGSISDLLQLSGCKRDLAKKIAYASIYTLPEQYNLSNPPDGFYDVKDKVVNTLENASIETLEKYFNNYVSKKYSGIINRIKLARDNGSKTMFSELADEIKPIISNSIIENRALASDVKIASAINEKEKLEQDLFGIWPVHLIQKRANVDKADDKILKRSDIKPGDNISFI